MTKKTMPGSRRPASGRREPRSRSRRGRRVLVVAILFMLFCAATARLFVFPVTGMPARVDAIVVPGGRGDRLGTAMSLVRQGRARYLLLSQGQFVPPYLCGRHVDNTLLLCFKPSPDTTQGEARATARLAREYGIRSIVLVTTADQTWRAELRFRRCYSGKVFAVTSPMPKLILWPFMIAYEWAATVKAEVINRDC